MTTGVGPLSIAPMTQAEAEAIAKWRYEPPYDFYDAIADQRDLEELLDTEPRGDCKRAIKVYERVGFVRTRTFVHETNGGLFRFVEMERAG